MTSSRTQWPTLRGLWVVSRRALVWMLDRGRDARAAVSQVRAGRFAVDLVAVALLPVTVLVWWLRREGGAYDLRSERLPPDRWPLTNRVLACWEWREPDAPSRMVERWRTGSDAWANVYAAAVFGWLVGLVYLVIECASCAVG